MRPALSCPLEVLHLAFVFLGRGARLERAEVAALAGLQIGLAGIEAVFARFQLADLARTPCLSRFGTHEHV